MLRTCDVRISPFKGKFAGSTTLEPNGRILLVIGQTISKRAPSYRSWGEITSAGRRPPCSRPVRGSKSVQTMSPARGAKSSFIDPLAADIVAPIERVAHRLGRHVFQHLRPSVGLAHRLDDEAAIVGADFDALSLSEANFRRQCTR